MGGRTPVTGSMWRGKDKVVAMGRPGFEAHLPTASCGVTASVCPPVKYSRCSAPHRSCERQKRFWNILKMEGPSVGGWGGVCTPTLWKSQNRRSSTRLGPGSRVDKGMVSSSGPGPTSWWQMWGPCARLRPCTSPSWGGAEERGAPAGVQLGAAVSSSFAIDVVSK